MAERLMEAIRNNPNTRYVPEKAPGRWTFILKVNETVHMEPIRHHLSIPFVWAMFQTIYKFMHSADPGSAIVMTLVKELELPPSEIADAAEENKENK